MEHRSGVCSVWFEPYQEYGHYELLLGGEVAGENGSSMWPCVQTQTHTHTHGRHGKVKTYHSPLHAKVGIWQISFTWW